MKLKTWHWIVIALLGLAIIGSLLPKAPAEEKGTQEGINYTDKYLQEKAKAEEQVRQRVDVGEDGVLVFGEAEYVPVSRDESTYERIIKSIVAHDEIGFKEEFDKGNAFLVKARTKAKVIDRTIGSRKIRILEGDHKDEAGWIAMEWVIKT